MYYFALLLGPESTDAPDPEAAAAEMAAYGAFHAKAASAIRGGDALSPSATGVRITGGPDAPIVTDGPFAEGAEVAGGYYVLEAENLDEALALARDIPAAKYGAVEVWPMVHHMPPTEPLTNNWIALLLEPADEVLAPGTPEWNELAAQHAKFAADAGSSRQRRRAAASAVDGDDGARARRQGIADRRSVHRGRRGGQRLPHPQRRRPRRGRQDRVDDPRVDRRDPPTHGHFWPVAAAE